MVKALQAGPAVATICVLPPSVRGFHLVPPIHRRCQHRSPIDPVRTRAEHIASPSLKWSDFKTAEGTGKQYGHDVHSSFVEGTTQHSGQTCLAFASHRCLMHQY